MPLATPPSRDLDVIVVSWNSAAHLAATLEALPAWCRVIVVDNASVDASVELARAHGAEVIELPENIGFPAGVNRGLREVIRPTVMLLNPDLVIGPTAIERCLDALWEDAGIGLVGPATTTADGEPEPSAARRDRTASQVLIESVGLVHISRRLDRQMVHDRSMSRDVDAVNGACMLMRTALLRSLGGMDTAVFMYLEDMDLCRRVRDAGYRVRFIADAPATHLGGASTARGDQAQQDRAYLHRIDADVEFVRRYGRRGAAGLAVAAHVLRAAIGCALTLVWRRRASRYRSALRYALAQVRGRTAPPAV
jgi:N-acetylglucosaminyl-diphospho-decaprenol L-rhamnosyltransferase